MARQVAWRAGSGSFPLLILLLIFFLISPAQVKSKIKKNGLRRVFTRRSPLK